MGKKIEFKIDIADFDKDGSARLKAAREEVAKIEKQITDAYLKSDRFTAARDLAGVSDYGTKNTPIISIQHNKIVTTIYADLADEVTVANRPTLYLGEKTINTLLSGNLLDEVQKKSLLKQIGFDADNLTT